MPPKPRLVEEANPLLRDVQPMRRGLVALPRWLRGHSVAHWWAGIPATPGPEVEGGRDTRRGTPVQKNGSWRDRLMNAWRAHAQVEA